MTEAEKGQLTIQMTKNLPVLRTAPGPTQNAETNRLLEPLGIYTSELNWDFNIHGNNEQTENSMRGYN